MVTTRRFSCSENTVTFVEALEHHTEDYSVDAETPLLTDKLESQRTQSYSQSWSKSSLTAPYAGIYLTFLILSLQQQTTGPLTSYIYSSFHAHSLLTTTTILSSIISGVFKLPTARLLDICGRTSGFILMTTFCTLGLLLMSISNTVTIYCVAQILYWVGHNGISYVLDVFIADTSSLRNRGLMFAFSTTPYVFNAYAGPALAQWFYEGWGFRWAFAIFGVVMPGVAGVVVVLMRPYLRRSAHDYTVEKQSPKGSESWTSLFVDFDVFGILLLTFGSISFLLPLSILGYTSTSLPPIITFSLIPIGTLLLALFYIHERHHAINPLLPSSLLTNPTLLGACLLSTVQFAAFYIWYPYFPSLLQVVYGLSIREAGYVANIYALGTCVFSIPIGLFIRRFGNFKIIGAMGVVLMVLGLGGMALPGHLVITFIGNFNGISAAPSATTSAAGTFEMGGTAGEGDTSITPLPVVVTAQLLIAAAGACLAISSQVAAISTSSTHTSLPSPNSPNPSTTSTASSLALLSLTSSLGSALGSALSGLIWTSTLPPTLTSFLPPTPDRAELVARLCGDLEFQLGYEMGSLEREALRSAYTLAWGRMCWVAAVVVLGGWGGVGLWRVGRVCEGVDECVGKFGSGRLGCGGAGGEGEA